MLREIHRYIWLSNWFMGRGLKKRTDRQTDRHCVDFNIDDLPIVLLKISPPLPRYFSKLSVSMQSVSLNMLYARFSLKIELQ